MSSVTSDLSSTVESKGYCYFYAKAGVFFTQVLFAQFSSEQFENSHHFLNQLGSCWFNMIGH